MVVIWKIFARTLQTSKALDSGFPANFKGSIQESCKLAVVTDQAIVKSRLAAHVKHACLQHKILQYIFLDEMVDNKILETLQTNSFAVTYSE